MITRTINAEALIQSAKILATTTTTITSITTTITTATTTTSSSNILILFKSYTIHVSKFIRIDYFLFTNNEFLTAIL